ncbi:MAG: hypothetical protein ACR2KW_00800 [Rubrobacter sp.]
MRRITVSERARYVFDNTVSRGPLALVECLFLVTTAMVLLGTLFVYLLGLAPAVDGRRPGFTETLWLDLMRTIDPGNIGGDAGGWPYLLTMLVITAGGILIFTTLIGVVNQGITDKVSDLRKGRSFVVERDHTVITRLVVSGFYDRRRACGRQRESRSGGRYRHPRRPRQG